MYGFDANHIINRSMENVNNINLFNESLDRLNEILEILYKDYTWNFLLKTTTISVVAGEINATNGVPIDYHNHYALKQVYQGQEKIITYIPYNEYILLNSTSDGQHMPSYWTVSPTFGEGTTQQAVVKIWPKVLSATDFVLHYYYLPDKLVANAIPVFPSHAYLVECLTNDLRGYLRHPGALPRENYIRQTIGAVRDNMFGGAIFASRIPLDPTVFGRRKRTSWD